MKKDIETEIYFTPRQAAEHFNLSLSTVKNYIYAGKLKTLRTPGGHHRIRKSELLATLGYKDISREDTDSFSLKMTMCSAILGIFKTLGPAGERMMLHARKVSNLSVKVAKVMDMDRRIVRRIEIAGLLHDIGHMGIDRNIFLKNELLTHQEYESVKMHPRIGKEFLSSIEGLSDIADIILQHHERIDGKGYPMGLSGTDIRQAARIISIAEAYDSMVSEYSYKRAISKNMAIDELIQGKGTQFDRDIVEIFAKKV